MAILGARRVIWAAGGLVALVLAVLVSLPYIASTRIVRDRIALEMSRWSGYRVEIEAPPAIHFWPGLSAALDGVTFSDWRDGKAVATVERIEIELSALAALRGDAVFTGARLVRPSWRIEQGAPGGFLPQFAGKGRILSAIERVRQTLDAAPGGPAAGGSDTAGTPLPDDPFGTVAFTDGRVVRPGDASLPPIVEDINGTIDWPRLNAPGSIAATAMWNGETVSVNLQSDTPLLLLAGGEAPLRAMLKARPAELTFDGTARLVGDPLLTGTLRLDAPSFDRLAVWAGADIPGWETLRSLSLSGEITGARERVKLDQATIKLDDSTGTGAVEIDVKPTQLTVSGSLAFDTMSLDTLLQAFLPLTTAEGGERLSTGSTGLPPARADLRLSASNGTIGGFAMTDVAAAIQIKDSFAAFDLLDASVFGGTAGMGLRVDRQAQSVAASLRITATDIDGAALAKAGGFTTLAPTGRGTISLDLKGDGETIAEALAEGSGSAKAQFGSGTLSGFDLGAFLERCKAGGFFPLAETARGDLAVDSVEVSATIGEGLAHVDRAEARFDGRSLWAAGVLSYADGGLALSGGLTAPDEGGDDTTFFVGGSLGAPFISPVQTTPPVE